MEKPAKPKKPETKSAELEQLPEPQRSMAKELVKDLRADTEDEAEAVQNAIDQTDEWRTARAPASTSTKDGEDGGSSSSGRP